MKTRLLLAALFAVGLAAGLAYAWLIAPPPMAASPANVAPAYRQAWLIMAAEAYARDGDWPRTQARLNALQDPSLAQTVTGLFTRLNAVGPNPTARALALIADRLGVRTAPMQVYLADLAIATTPTPAPPTAAPIGVTAAPPTVPPTVAVTPTSPPAVIITEAPPAAYQVVRRTVECTRPPDKPQIRVIIQDAQGQGRPGQTVWITWDQGTDRFVTGLRPEIDPGYGDFEMQPDQIYNVSVGRADSVAAGGLQAAPCAGNGLTSWSLTLKPAAP